MTDDEVKELVQNGDSDGDGQINYEGEISFLQLFNFDIMIEGHDSIRF